jgi:hypothetical protein
MNGREQKQLLQHWRKKHIKTWQLVALFLACLISSLLLMRQNNLKMVELRNLVIQADEQGGDVSGALKKLNEHVFHHINTKIVRPIELVHSYNRQAQAAIEAANKGSGRDIYAEATAACERRGIPITSIAQCAAEYALANNPGVGPTKINLPDKNLFKYTFASPKWVPDAAGIMLLITGVVGLWLIARFAEYLAVHMIIRSRLKNDFI